MYRYLTQMALMYRYLTRVALMLKCQSVNKITEHV